MKSTTKSLATLRGKLVVSCQAVDGSPFRHSESMARFARAAVDGGAGGIRANSPEDIQAIRQAVQVPIIGIWKAVQDDGKVLITPSFKEARKLVEAGAGLVALDCTARGQRYGALDRLQRIKQELGVPVLADIATFEEAVQAAHAGADAVLSTMRGYTAETQCVVAFEPSFIAELVGALDVPVIAEGRIQSVEEARAALHAGAYALIVGTAITRPEVITRGFASAVDAWHRSRDSQSVFIGIDMGGTATKSGLVTSTGQLISHSSTPTPWNQGRQALLDHLQQCVSVCRDNARGRGIEPQAIGVATAGWVNPACGQVVYATENLPGWTGANPALHLRKVSGLPVAVENDANALAVAEKLFGAAQAASDFVCITLGTGVGGGCYIGGRLNHGGHFFANALGHIPVVPGGLPCTCGKSGCLEVYANAAALLRYAQGSFASCENITAAANDGDPSAQGAVKALAQYLAVGCACIVNVLDPEMVILAGGLAQDNPLLVSTLSKELEKRVTVWPQRRLRVQASNLGYWAGVLGAAAVASAAILAGTTAE
jgi:predicted NBD/HSP70 family sugar kinase/putative N-acetylmannosamine-6-phosphate epimerase